MRQLLKVLLIGALLALVIAPAAAQNDGTNVITTATFGSSVINTLNPLTASTSTEFDLVPLMFPGLLSTNPETALVEPHVPGALFDSWEVSEDGTVYTFHMKQNFNWSDGTPVTARDVEVLWKATVDGTTETIYTFLLDIISDIVAVDDYTVRVTFPDASCEGLLNLPSWAFPSHLILNEDGSYNFAAINDLTFTDPETAVYTGPYVISSSISDQQLAMVSAADVYPDEEGDPVNDGYAIRIVGDQTIMNEQFLAGQFDYMDFVPPDRQDQVRETEGVEVYEYFPGSVYDYLALNFANPDNPQEGRDADGNEVVQDPHPLFGDVRVRKALAHALDMDAVIEAALFGNGQRMNSPWVPGTWVFEQTNQVEEMTYDPELAMQMLEEAGFIDQDGDGVRECHGCMYAEEGTPLEFTLFTNQGNTRRTAFGQIAQDYLQAVGARVDFQTIDFNVLIELMDAQTFDAAIVGWGAGYPYSPDNSQLFAISSDTFGGSNDASFHSAEFDRLMQQALFLPGCDPEERAAIYGQAAQVWVEQLPYIGMYSVAGMFTWQDYLQNVNPYPNNMLWNLTEWSKRPVAAAP